MGEYFKREYQVGNNIYIIKLQKKHFTKMQKHVGLASTKKLTKQDGTHITIRSQITIPTSIFPTTHTIIPFWNGCVCLCVVNSRISLWGLWVGVCIEGSSYMSKVIVVPWVSSCIGFVPEGSSMSSRGYKSHTP